MKTLYIIDISGFIFRAFYALPPLTRSDGTPVGAVFGFCNMMLKLRDLIKERSGNDALWVGAFDVSRRNFRNDIDENYKSNRKETPIDLVPQFSIIKEAVSAFGCHILEKEGFEADDIIATCTKEAQKKDINVVIVSSDKDLMQLYDNSTLIFDPMKNKWISIEDIENKFGVLPNKIVDVQALAGDTSDGIQGVPGIGIKTAAELIKKFGSLEMLLSNVHTITQKKRKETLEQFSQSARTAKLLVSLRNDVDVKIDFDEMKFHSDFSSDLVNNLKLFFEKQEFSGLLKKITSIQKNHITTKDEVVNVFFIDNDNSFENFSNKLKLKNLNVYVSPVFKKNEEAPTTFILMFKDGEEYFFGIFKKDCKDYLKVLIQNFQNQILFYDYKSFLHFVDFNVDINNFDDLQQMAYLLLGGGQNTISDMISKFSTIKSAKFNIVIDNKELEESITNMISFDEIYNSMNKIIHSDQVLQNIYKNIDIPFLSVVYKMEKNGVFIDKSIISNLSKEFEKELQSLELTIYQLSGKEFNIASPQQLGKILFEDLKISPQKKHKSGQYKTDSATLMELMLNSDNKIIPVILKWRQLFKLYSTYTNTLIDYINPNTNRVHTNFLLTQTNTGRLSSQNPNLQNIPIRTIQGSKIRTAFVGEGENFLASFDYSQIELRLLAYIGNVQGLKQAFENNEDIHRITASKIFQQDLESVSNDERQKAKAVNFGIIYGQGSFGLAQQLKITNKEAEGIIEAYFKTYPEILEYIESTKDFASKNGFVETIFGRRCYIPNINSKNFNLRQFAQRQAVNAVLQGSNADIIKIAMNKIDKIIDRYNIKMILQIHDELIFEGEKCSLQNSSFEISKIMSESAVEKLIPLKVNFKIAKSWHDAHF